MLDYNLYIPVSLYNELESLGSIKNEEHWDKPAKSIKIDVFNKKRELWDNYVKTSKRQELFKIGSIVTNSHQDYPRNVYMIVDIVFDRYGMKPEIKEETNEVEFEYEVMCLGNISSYDAFKKTGEVICYRNNFLYVHSDILNYAECFDSLVCNDMDDFFRIFHQQLDEVKRTLVKKRFMGYNAVDSFCYDYSDSKYTFKIKDVQPAYGITSFILIPDGDYNVIKKKSKGRRDDYYDVFIKETKDRLPFDVMVHINPDTNKLEFRRGGFIYSERKTVSYISNMFRRGYKYMGYRDGFDYKRIVQDEFVMSKILFPDDNSALRNKYQKFFESKHLRWDTGIIGKTVAGFALSERQRWILFKDNSFLIQKAKKYGGETFYKTITKSVISEFGSIHGFFAAMTSGKKNDHLNNFGELFCSHDIFTKDEIISNAKSDI